MKILLVVEPGIDGVFRHVEGLVHFLMERDHEIHLAYSSVRGSDALNALVKSIEEKGWKTLDLRVGNAPCVKDFPAFFKLWRLVKKIKPDVIHGHSSKAGALVRMLRLTGMNTPLFYTPNAYYGMAPRNKISIFIFNLIEKIFGKIGRTFNISLDESRFAKETLGISPSQITISHNSVNSRVFVPASLKEKGQKRARLGLKKDALILGFMGRLSFQKDPQTLYRALAPILKQNPDLVFFQVGRGELADELDLLASELGIRNRIVRQSYLNDPSIFYHVIDALIVTSRYEAGWPIVILEALSCDLPIIASVAPGTSDLNQGGLSHCWNAKIGDVSGFSKAIEDWMTDASHHRPCNHRKIAIERFSPEKCYGIVAEEYGKAVFQ